MLLVGGLTVLSACGKSHKQASSPPAVGVAGADSAVTIENAPYASVIKAHGFKIVEAKRFPAQLSSRHATVVVYQSADGNSGGVLYTQRMIDGPPRVSWHWLFRDSAPDSVQALELNDDGLWDVRVFMKGGKVSDFIQNKDFTFLGPERDDLIALNGDSSDAGDLWKCFDGDTSTVWRSPSKDAFIELSNPFGLKTGELSVRLAGSDRPNEMTLVAGTDKESLKLDKTTGEQRFKLDEAVKTAPTIRLQMDGTGPNVAISELEIR